MKRSGKLTMSSIALLAFGIAACQGTPGGASPSQAPGSAASASLIPSINETSTAKPRTLPRPTDVPTDGTCEEGHVCLGILTPGTAYTTADFQPHVTFSVPEAGWENIADGQGAFDLRPIDTPGDAIVFFHEAHAAGVGSSAVGSTVEELSAWLGANPLLEVTAPQAVTIGGATGLSMDIRLAANAANQDPGCPVQVCVTLMKGLDPSPPVEWDWDWGSAGTEVQRLYLVTSNDGVVAIFVDSLDGVTFDSLTTRAAAILETVKFG